MSFSYINPETREVEEFKTPFFVNTNEFRREALYFEKHGKYPDFEDEDYWDEQENRIINGYTVGGVHITGNHYYYLNFNQIKITIGDASNEIVSKGQYQRKKKGTKLFTFPDFWDSDFDFFHAKRISKEFGLDLCIGKTRQRGYTFKCAAIGGRRYKFISQSVTIYVASDKKYLYSLGDAIGVYAKGNINFINKTTPWSRGKLIDRTEYIKEGYYHKLANGLEVESGFLSEMFFISMKDNPDAARGKTGADIIYEECGKFPNLLSARTANEPLTQDGDYKVGQQIYFGTGGGKDANWEGFEEIYYNAKGYGCLEFVNIWDEEGGNNTGLFIPVYMNKKGHFDENGNSNVESAKKSELLIREEKEKVSKNALVGYCMENPFSPSEAFKRSSHNIFPVKELNAQLQRLIDGREYDEGRAFEIEMENSKLNLVQTKGRLIDSFPLKENEDATPVLWLYEKPFTVNGIVPDNLYLICCDPVRFDYGTSLYASYIIMNPNNVTGNGGDYIVGSFIGRTDFLDEYHSKLFQIAEVFNAKISAENDVGTGILDYAKRFKKTMYLERDFELAHDIRFATVNAKKRGFGMSMASGKEDLKKKAGDTYIKDWLLTERFKSLDGKTILNLHLIKDKGLLKELIKYNPVNGNFDRISALRIGMYHMREYIYKGRMTKKEINPHIKQLMSTKLFA